MFRLEEEEHDEAAAEQFLKVLGLGGEFPNHHFDAKERDSDDSD